MKLDALYIEQFKNLSRLHVDFDEASLTTVLVGRNGSGKSNILEALILIFRHLDLVEDPPFKYWIKYICRGQSVEVDADPFRVAERVRILVDNQPRRIIKSRTAKNRDYLPAFVFGYYSGSSDRMAKHFKAHENLFYKELLDGKDEPFRPLFYAQLVHSFFVLLAFYTEDDPKIKEFLSKELRIHGFESALFVLSEPDWNSKDGDPRFWNARGVVQVFLDRLYRNSLAPIRTVQTISISFRKKRRREHLYLYLRDLDALRHVSNQYSSQREFFKALESTNISELLREVRVTVKVSDASGRLTFRDMSEGEQQLLMVLGLLRFTNEEEALFLLDEPDTHLNPAWSVRYLQMLREVVGDQPASHVIIATHNPLVIAELERSQVQIMSRDEYSGTTRAEHPEQDPRGMGIAGLLTSDIYGLRSQLDIPTIDLLYGLRVLTVRTGGIDAPSATSGSGCALSYDVDPAPAPGSG